MTRSCGRVARGALVLAAILLTGCVTEVKLAPDDPSWAVADAVATWTADEVSVEVPIYTDAGEFPGRGSIVNRWDAPIRVTFAPDVGAGDVGDGRTGRDEPAPLAVGTPYEVPAARDGAPGRLPFALRPDERWADVPTAGARLTWTITVTTPSGETRCPFRFQVESTSRRLSQGAKIGIAVVVIVGVVWAVAASVEREQSDFQFNMSLPAL
jgi:hypothetical protein